LANLAGTPLLGHVAKNTLRPLPQRWYRRTLGPLTVTAFLVYIFFGIVLLARATNHWQTNLPRAVYMDLVPRAGGVTHPGI